MAGGNRGVCSHDKRLLTAHFLGGRAIGRHGQLHVATLVVLRGIVLLRRANDRDGGWREGVREGWWVHQGGLVCDGEGLNAHLKGIGRCFGSRSGGYGGGVCLAATWCAGLGGDREGNLGGRMDGGGGKRKGEEKDGRRVEGGINVLLRVSKVYDPEKCSTYTQVPQE